MGAQEARQAYNLATKAEETVAEVEKLIDPQRNLSFPPKNDAWDDDSQSQYESICADRVKKIETLTTDKSLVNLKEYAGRLSEDLQSKNDRHAAEAAVEIEKLISNLEVTASVINSIDISTRDKLREIATNADLKLAISGATTQMSFWEELRATLPQALYESYKDANDKLLDAHKLATESNDAVNPRKSADLYQQLALQAKQANEQLRSRVREMSDVQSLLEEPTDQVVRAIRSWDNAAEELRHNEISPRLFDIVSKELEREIQDLRDREAEYRARIRSTTSYDDLNAMRVDAASVARMSDALRTQAREAMDKFIADLSTDTESGSVLHQLAVASPQRRIELRARLESIPELLKAVVDLPNDQGDTPLTLAATHADADTIKFLLRSLSANPLTGNDEAGGETALHFAARRGDETVLLALLRAYSTPDISDTHGMTPLMIAALTGKHASVEVLLRHGANPQLIDSLSGNNALHYAVYGGNARVVEIIMSTESAMILCAQSNNQGLRPSDLVKSNDPILDMLNP